MTDLLYVLAFFGLMIVAMFGNQYVERRHVIDRCPSGKDVALCFQEADAADAAAKAAKEALQQEARALDEQRRAKLATTPYVELELRDKMTKLVDEAKPYLFVVAMVGVLASIMFGLFREVLSDW